MVSENAGSASVAFERERWQTEVDLRRKELALKEREQTRLAAEAARSRWWNPLVIAIAGATIAALGSIGVSWWNGRISQQTEELRAESARIIEMIHAADIPRAKENLRFLLATGLITGPTSEKLQKYLDEAPAESGPLLPLLSLAQPASPSTEASVISEFLCLEGDRRNQYWIYRYTARRPGDPTFRVVRPPNWGEAIGGHDLFTREEAEKVARDACNSKS